MIDSSLPARLWYQSFVYPIEQAPYIEQLQSVLDSAAGPSAFGGQRGHFPRRNGGARAGPSTGFLLALDQISPRLAQTPNSLTGRNKTRAARRYVSPVPAFLRSPCGKP